MPLFHYVHVFTCPIPHISVWKFARRVVAQQQQQQQQQQLAEEATDNLFDHFPPTGTHPLGHCHLPISVLGRQCECLPDTYIVSHMGIRLRNLSSAHLMMWKRENVFQRMNNSFKNWLALLQGFLSINP